MKRTLLQNQLHTLCPLMLTLMLAACGGGGSSSKATAADTISGTLSVLDGGPILEMEPNNDASQAQSLGALYPGSQTTVLGTMTDGDVDTLDVFRISAPTRSSFQVTLTASDTSGATDFFFLLADAVSLQAVEVFQGSNSNVETGTFIAQGAFFLVLINNSGSSDYALSIGVSSAPSPIPEREINDAPGQAGYLGELVLGDALTVSGNLGQGSDISDRFLVALPQAGNLALLLDSLSATSQDFDIEVNDATADLFNPVLLQRFETAADPEVGQVACPAMSLIEVRVYPFNGATGPYSLSLAMTSTSNGAGGSGPGTGSTHDLSQMSRGNVTSQLANLRGEGARSFFERPALRFVPGELLVAGTSDAALQQAITERGGVLAGEVPGQVRRVRFLLPASLDEVQRERYTVALAASLDAHPAVRYAELNLLLQPLMVDTTPNDPLYNFQWHYSLINLPAAWDITTGSNSVIVAVIDTGTTPGVDLAPRTLAGYDLISDPAMARDGDGPDPDPTDEGDSTGPQNSSFHGSHVAGTVGANTNDGFGAAGVTWSTRIMPIRVLGVGGGTTFDIASGIRFAAGLPNSSGALPPQSAHIINMSLGGPGVSQTMQDAVTDARNAGTLVIAAAGNANSSDPFSPAVLNGVISVSAVDAQGVKAPYSNFHPTVDIAAPGGDIEVDRTGDGYPDGVLSCRPNDRSNPTDYDAYEFYEGTSMAAPHVAGVAALLLAADPTLSVPQLENILLSTTTDRGAPGRDDEYGEGLINAFAAVQMAAGGGGNTPALALSTSSTLLSASSRNESVLVSNVGGGLLQVSGVNSSTQSGGSWLSAVAVPITNPTSSDTSAIDIRVDPTGLNQGTYLGSVQVQSNGGTKTIAVSLDLSGSGGGGTQMVFVLAVELTTMQTVAQITVQSPDSLSYGFPNLPAGTYLVVAGTDTDGDGFILDEGEPLSGVYPSFEAPIALSVTADSTLRSIDFPLQSPFSGSSAGSNPFARLE